MTKQQTELPMASKEMEANAREIFPINISPEEFAAKDGAGWLDFMFANFQFSDQALNHWIHTVGDIVRDPEKLDEVQRKYLSKDNLARMKKYRGVDIDDDDEF